MVNKLHILSSGSKANAVILESGDSAILIDQGLTTKVFMQKAMSLGVDLSKIKFILLTHEHSDHMRGISLTAQKLSIPVYSAEKTINILNRDKKHNFDAIPLKESLSLDISGFEITPFAVMHDVVEPFGYTVKLPDGEKFAIATDTGMVTNSMMSYIAETNYLFIEANHDPDLLYSNRKYPWDVKQRIRSNYGHLSNDQCRDVISRVADNSLKIVVAGHLSQENNKKDMVFSMLRDVKTAYRLPFQPFAVEQEESCTVILS